MIVEAIAHQLERINMLHAAANQAIAQDLHQIADMPLADIDAVQKEFRAAIGLLLDGFQLGQAETEGMLPSRPLQYDRLHQAAFVSSTPSLKLMFSV